MTDMWWPIVAQICEVNMLRSFLRYVLRPPAVAFTFADRNPRVIKLWRHRIFVSRARSYRGRMGSGTVPHGGGAGVGGGGRAGALSRADCQQFLSNVMIALQEK